MIAWTCLIIKKHKDIGQEDTYYDTKISIFSFTWAGLTAFHSKHNIMKVVCPKKSGHFHWLGIDLNLFKVLGNTLDSTGHPQGNRLISRGIGG